MDPGLGESGAPQQRHTKPSLTAPYRGPVRTDAEQALQGFFPAGMRFSFYACWVMAA